MPAWMRAGRTPETRATWGRRPDGRDGCRTATAGATVRGGRGAAVLVAIAALLGGAGAAEAATRTGPTVLLRPTPWTDCGDGTGGSERLATVATDAAHGYALHEHRYCPTRPVTVSYHFYAYDASDRNICALLGHACDRSLPFGAFAVSTVTFTPADFALGGACFLTGCPVIGALPAGNVAQIKNVIVEPIDDAGSYGVTHNVLWDPASPPAIGPAPAGPGTGVAGPSAPADPAASPLAPADPVPAPPALDPPGAPSTQPAPAEGGPAPAPAQPAGAPSAIGAPAVDPSSSPADAQPPAPGTQAPEPPAPGAAATVGVVAPSPVDDSGQGRGRSRRGRT